MREMATFLSSGRVGIGRFTAVLSLLLLSTSAAFGQGMDEPEVLLDSGDTAWMLTSTALVLLMTLPGLALFYGGLVRSKNVLSVLVQCLVSAGLIGVL